MEIVVNKEVRELLLELAHAVVRFDALTAALSIPGISHQEAVDAGARREHYKVVILGVANRLYHASAKKEFF